VEQTYGELRARITTVMMLVPSISLEAPSVMIHDELVARASTAVRQLRTNPGAAAGEWMRLLWPHGTAPSAEHWWWSTPLGILIGPPCPRNGRTGGPAPSSCRSSPAATGMGSTADPQRRTSCSISASGVKTD
jgi:hypothetical protein